MKNRHVLMGMQILRKLGAKQEIKKLIEQYTDLDAKTLEAMTEDDYFDWGYDILMLVIEKSDNAQTEISTFMEEVFDIDDFLEADFMGTIETLKTHESTKELLPFFKSALAMMK